MLVITYKLVKCLCHLVEIALAEPRMERERESPLEGPIGIARLSSEAARETVDHGVRGKHFFQLAPRVLAPTRLERNKAVEELPRGCEIALLRSDERLGEEADR